MKTNPRIIAGITCLTVSVILLGTKIYLDELDQQFAQSWYSVHCNGGIMCPIAPQVNGYLIQLIVYVDIIVFCIGIILLSYEALKNKMKSTQK